MTTLAPKFCPECRASLDPGHKNGLSTWQCPAGHGVGINLIEAYGHLQRDELEAIWGGAHKAPSSPLVSPITGRQMVEVTFTVDDDMHLSNAGENARQMTIEVDVENYFGWFSLDELRSMPEDTTNRGGSQMGVVGLAQMDDGDDENAAVFNNLTDEDFEDDGHYDEDDGDSGKGLNRVLNGLARRLRS